MEAVISAVVGAVVGAVMAGGSAIYLHKRSREERLADQSAEAIGSHDDTLRDLQRFVLPHFIPPGPGGHDVTVPAQLRDLNEGVVQGRVEIGQIRTDLREHMSEEERLRKEENARQQGRQEDIEIRMEAGERRFDALDTKIDGVNAAVSAVQADVAVVSSSLTQALESMGTSKRVARPHPA